MLLGYTVEEDVVKLCGKLETSFSRLDSRARHQGEPERSPLMMARK